MSEIASEIYQRIENSLAKNATLSEPILYTLGVKIASGSLGTHGVDCYQIGQFTNLSEDELLNISSATELAWTIILMYDDILDNDSVRYGEPTAWVKYGTSKTKDAINYGLEVARTLHLYKDTFDKMYTECLGAMNDVKYLPLESDSSLVEKTYRGYTFGCYDYLLPFDNTTKNALSSIGYKKMLMAQLINDYKDTCGSRRKSRDYPELRECQANYITSLHIDTLKEAERIQFAELIRESNNSADYEAIALTLKMNVSSVLKKIGDLVDAISNDVTRIRNEQLRLHMTEVTEKTAESFRSLIRNEISS